MESQIEKLQAELEKQNEYVQMLEEQIKENDQQIDKQKKEMEKKDNEITKLKKDLQEAIKKADVFSSTDDVGGAKILQLEVEIHDLQRNIVDQNKQIQQLTQELKSEKKEEMKMEILKSSIEKFQDELQRKNVNLQMLQEQIKQDDEQIDKQKMEIENKNNEIQKLKENYQQAADIKENEIMQLKIDLEETIQKADAFRSKLGISEAQIIQLETQTGNYQKFIDDKNAQIKSVTQELNQKQLSFEKVELQIQELQAELNNQNEYVQMLEEQIKENDEQIDKQKKEIENKDNKITKLIENAKKAGKIKDDEIKQQKTDLQEIKQKFDSFRSSLDISETKTKQLEAQIHDQQKHIVDQNNQILSLTQDLNEKQLEVEKSQNQIEKLKEEYENLNEYVEIIEERIKEKDDQIDKQNKDKIILQEELKKSITCDVDEVQKVQFEVEVKCLQQQIADQMTHIMQLKNEMNYNQEEMKTEIAIQKESYQKQISQQLELINNLQNTVKELKSQNEVSEKQIATQTNDSDILLEEIDQLTKQVEEQAQSILKKDKQIEDLQLQGGKSGSMEGLEKQSKSADTHELEEKINQLEEVLLQYQEENQQFIKKEEVYQKEKETLLQEIQQLKKEIIEQQEKGKQEQDTQEQIEQFKCEYEDLADEYNQLNDKLGEAEQENSLLNNKCQELFTIKDQLECKIKDLEDKLQHQNEVNDENNELKQLIKQTQEQVNNLQSNNEYQTLYLQLRDEHEDYKEQITATINQKDQQLYQAAQFIQELEALKESTQILEENNNLLTNKLQIQQENNLKYQQRIEELEAELNDLKNQYQDINDISLKLKQLREENEELKTQNYEQDEMIKNYEIQLDSLRQIEYDSPKKISKLQQENTETAAEYTKFKETTQREIHQLKYEKQQNQNEIIELKQKIETQLKARSQLETVIGEFKQMLDGYVIAEKAIESKIYDISDQQQIFENEQTTLVEKFEIEIQELNENIEQMKFLQNLRAEQMQSNLEVLCNEQCIQTETLSEDEKLQIQQIETCEQASNTEELNQDNKQIYQEDKNYREQQIQTEFAQFQQPEETVTQLQFIQSDSVQPLSQKLLNCYSQNNEQSIVDQRNQNIQNSQVLEHSMIESLKKKVEELENLRKSYEKEITRLKDLNKKVEEKYQALQKHNGIKRQSDIKEERKNFQDNESISRLQTQMNQLQQEFRVRKTNNFKDQNDSYSNELEELQLKLDSCKEELIKQKQQAIKYKTKLDAIYSLGPYALNQLQSEPKIQFQQQQSQQLEKYQIQNFLYIKQLGDQESYFFEVIRKELKVYKNQTSKLQKSMFDSYILDEIFFDSQKIHQYFEKCKQKLLSNSNKVFLILGKSKTHKKLIMMILIELINNLILKQQLNQKISICYQERINEQWIEVEYMNTQRSSQQHLECAMNNIQTHLQTKQSSTGEKIRRLSITYQYSTENQISTTQQLIIATCPSLPSGDFKGITQQILNQKINQSMQFTVFLNISPSLQHQQQTLELLYMTKLISYAKGQLQLPNYTSNKSVGKQIVIDDESQKQIRIVQNKLILKKHEVDRMKKIFDNQLKQIHELQIKFDQQIAYKIDTQNLISNIIMEIKQKINLKMKQKQNKTSETYEFLNKLAVQLDLIANGKYDSISNSEINEDQTIRSRSSVIPLY